MIYIGIFRSFDESVIAEVMIIVAAMLFQVTYLLLFSCSQDNPDPGNEGTYNASSNSWNGIVGSLQAYTTDYAIGPFTLTEARYDALVCSIGYLQVGKQVSRKEVGCR